MSQTPTLFAGARYARGSLRFTHDLTHEQKYLTLLEKLERQPSPDFASLTQTERNLIWYAVRYSYDFSFYCPPDRAYQEFRQLIGPESVTTHVS